MPNLVTSSTMQLIVALTNALRAANYTDAQTLACVIDRRMGIEFYVLYVAYRAEHC